MRTLLKRFISEIVLRSGLTDLYARRTPGVRILTYHRVGKDPYPGRPLRDLYVSPVAFERQIAFLRCRYELLALSELRRRMREGHPLPANGVVVTFDDGYQDNYVHAFPVLRQHSVPATIFLATDFIGTNRRFWWEELAARVAATQGQVHVKMAGLTESYDLDVPGARRQLFMDVVNRAVNMPPVTRGALLEDLREALGDTESAPGVGGSVMLSWDEVREMAGQGIEFGGHTASHVVLTALPDRQAREEVVACKEAIEAALGQPCRSFAYPNEASSATVVRMVREAGYEVACVGGGKPNRLGPKSDWWRLQRIPVSDVGGWAVFRNRVAGLYPLLTARPVRS
ncbi:MAG TPA: hypothetical protein EYH31_07970 [Anaerolineae bacterium]|nr:hypothetical protein [Anaerolineae bacterium]